MIQEFAKIRNFLKDKKHCKEIFGMKIGIGFDRLTAFSKWGDECYKKIKEFGFSCVDYNMSDTNDVIYTSSEAESDAVLLKDKALAKEAGIEIFQVHGPWRWPARDFTDEDRAERMEKMKKSIRMTSVIGCKNWVIHPIMPYGVVQINNPDEVQKTWDMNIEFMSELLKTAKEYDVTICLENMPMLEFSLAKPADILRVVEAINDEHFKICLDTGHVSVFEELSLGDEVRRLGDKIQTLHVHDNRYSKDLHMMPYYGIINWQEFADALHEINYSGVFSLETAPPVNLPLDIYEDMYRALFRIADAII